LIEEFGSQQETFTAVWNAAQDVVRSEGLMEVIEITVNIGGQEVVVAGRVINGFLRIGTFYIL